MQLNTAFLLGFLLGLASLVVAAPGVAHGLDKRSAPDCSKYAEGCHYSMLNLQRYAGDTCEGKKIGPLARVEKFQCYHFKKRPVESLSINVKLPINTSLNRCDVTFYDGKHCHGNVVQQIWGNQSLEYNSQSHCMTAPWLKSMRVGPCN